MLDPNWNYVEMRKWLRKYMSKLDIKPMNKMRRPKSGYISQIFQSSMGHVTVFRSAYISHSRNPKRHIQFLGGGCAIGLSGSAHDGKVDIW